MRREWIGAGLIIFAWVSIISMIFKEKYNTIGSMLLVIVAFGGAWLMLSEGSEE